MTLEVQTEMNECWMPKSLARHPADQQRDVFDLLAEHEIEGGERAEGQQCGEIP